MWPLLTLQGGLKGVKVTKVACGTNHCVALSEEGDVYTWGFGGYGRLGHKVRSIRSNRRTDKFIATKRRVRAEKDRTKEFWPRYRYRRWIYLQLGSGSSWSSICLGKAKANRYVELPGVLSNFVQATAICIPA